MRRTIFPGLLSVLIITGLAVEPRPAEAGDLSGRARDFVTAVGSDVVAIMADKAITNAQGLERFHRLSKQNSLYKLFLTSHWVAITVSQP